MMMRLVLKFLKDRLRLLPIDFFSPWWKVITKQRFYMTVALTGEVIYSIFRPLAVLLLGMAFSSGRVDYFVMLFCLWASIYTISLVSRLANSIVQLQAIHSLHYRAHQWFLQVDPLCHSHRSSGTILGKIDRASRAFEDFSNAVSNDFLQTFIGIATVIVTLSWYHWWLGALTFILLAVILLLNFLVSRNFIVPYEKRLLRADDKVRGISAENLAQISLVRTCFATDQAIGRLKVKEMKGLRKEGDLWFLNNFFYFLVRLLYLSSIFLLGWYVLLSIRSGEMTGAIGLSLLLSYLRGSYDIIKIEKPMRDVIKSITRIKDLFDYVVAFGRQTFPVLKKVPSKCRIYGDLTKDPITIDAQRLFFDYSVHARVFSGHSFSLQVPLTQENKLYGIIGPSGMGKSTFISVIGGQIKPTEGLVSVNDVNLYLVDDDARRRLLAVQGQVATSIRGTLRKNLLFGLPKRYHNITDNDLITLLGRVGLWELFKAKEGLDTFVGEGGQTLSGGQRQRLNFANLYLRAEHYKPQVILIDEPTSSLDEISEQAITEMIVALSKSAVTMVIAHRLKTVTDAVGLIDFSLLSEEKTITVYTQDELMRKSAYYKQLFEGKVSIEE